MTWDSKLKTHMRIMELVSTSDFNVLESQLSRNHLPKMIATISLKSLDSKWDLRSTGFLSSTNKVGSKIKNKICRRRIVTERKNVYKYTPTILPKAVNLFEDDSSSSDGRVESNRILDKRLDADIKKKLGRKSIKKTNNKLKYLTKRNDQDTRFIPVDMPFVNKVLGKPTDNNTHQNMTKSAIVPESDDLEKGKSFH